MSETQPDDAAGAVDDSTESEKPAFTKEPQPELPLALRREKAGWTKNRIAIWVAVGAFALFMIIEGTIGILTKAR